MFGKKKERDQETPFQRSAEHPVLTEGVKRESEDENRPEAMVKSARLSSDTQVEGAIRFDGTMKIDGKVNGEISTDNGKLIVSDSGIINATITTKSAVINGRVDGNVIASDKVVLKQKAHLTGNLQAKTLVIEEGVIFIGQCNVDPGRTRSDKIAINDQPKIHHIQQKNFSTNERNTAKSA